MEYAETLESHFRNDNEDFIDNMLANVAVNSRIINFHKSNRPTKEELKELDAEILNESIWLNGATTEEDKNMHKNNIKNLVLYKIWLEKDSMANNMLNCILYN